MASFTPAAHDWQRGKDRFNAVWAIVFNFSHKVRSSDAIASHAMQGQPGPCQRESFTRC